MKKIIALIIVLSTTGVGFGQKFFTKSGEISFLSEAPLETIEARNNQATSVIDSESGAIQWAVLIKAFKFEKALMEEHFNENYMESDEFPKAKFKGKILNMSEIDFAKEGTQEATVKGTLEIHGVEREVETTATFTMQKGKIKGACSFTILVEDYKIEIPGVVKDNIAKEVDITITAYYEPLNK